MKKHAVITIGVEVRYGEKTRALVAGVIGDLVYF